MDNDSISQKQEVRNQQPRLCSWDKEIIATQYRSLDYQESCGPVEVQQPDPVKAQLEEAKTQAFIERLKSGGRTH